MARLRVRVKRRVLEQRNCWFWGYRGGKGERVEDEGGEDEIKWITERWIEWMKSES